LISKGKVHLQEWNDTDDFHELDLALEKGIEIGLVEEFGDAIKELDIEKVENELKRKRSASDRDEMEERRETKKTKSLP